MYRGVNLDGVKVSSYETALATYEQRSTKKRARWLDEHHDWALGPPKAGVTGVRLDGQAVIFRLYGTDVITWEPDGVTIDNYGTKTTSEFCAALLPAGISVGHDVKRRDDIDCENRTITYPAQVYSLDTWHEYWRTRHICDASGGPVTFRQKGEFWFPDEATVTPLKVPVLDRTGARKASKQYNLREFRLWLEMALPLFYEPVEHEGESYGKATEALLGRDFWRAAQHLPLVEQPRGFGIRLKPLNVSAPYYYQAVTMRSFEMLKDHIYDHEMLIGHEHHATLPYSTWQAARRRVKQLEAAGVYI